MRPSSWRANSPMTNRFLSSTVCWMPFDDRPSAPLKRSRDREGAGYPARFLLPDTERREYAVKNVVGRRRARDRIQRLQRRIKIQQQHFVRDAELHGALRVLESL